MSYPNHTQTQKPRRQYTPRPLGRIEGLDAVSSVVEHARSTATDTEREQHRAYRESSRHEGGRGRQQEQRHDRRQDDGRTADKKSLLQALEQTPGGVLPLFETYLPLIEVERVGITQWAEGRPTELTTALQWAQAVNLHGEVTLHRDLEDGSKVYHVRLTSGAKVAYEATGLTLTHEVGIKGCVSVWGLEAKEKVAISMTAKAGVVIGWSLPIREVTAKPYLTRVSEGLSKSIETPAAPAGEFTAAEEGSGNA